jgi:hypothetical protein
MADADAGNKLSLGGWNAARENGAEAALQVSAVAVGPVAKLLASGSPSWNAARANGAEVERQEALQVSAVAVGRPVAKLPVRRSPSWNAARASGAEVQHPEAPQGSAVAVGPVAKLTESRSPSPGSSDGNGKGHQGASGLFPCGGCILSLLLFQINVVLLCYLAELLGFMLNNVTKLL